jgi:hypothetical protein
VKRLEKHGVFARRFGCDRDALNTRSSTPRLQQSGEDKLDTALAKAE